MRRDNSRTSAIGAAALALLLVACVPGKPPPTSVPAVPGESPAAEPTAAGTSAPQMPTLPNTLPTPGGNPNPTIEIPPPIR